MTKSKERRIFEETYPAKVLGENPVITIEAVGYLKHLKVTNPEQAEWIDTFITTLLLFITLELEM